MEVYAEAQHQNNDSKELGAATATVMFNVIQLLRTLMLIVQLEVFFMWCKHALECLRAKQGADEERDEQSEGESSEWEGSNQNNSCVFKDKESVNITVIDNELGRGCDSVAIMEKNVGWVEDGRFQR